MNKYTRRLQYFATIRLINQSHRDNHFAQSRPRPARQLTHCGLAPLTESPNTNSVNADSLITASSPTCSSRPARRLAHRGSPRSPTRSSRPRPARRLAHRCLVPLVDSLKHGLAHRELVFVDSPCSGTCPVADINKAKIAPILSSLS